MIKINTSHILPDVPYLLEGTESSDVLGLPPDAVPPLVPAGDITYRLSAVMAGADLVVTGSASVPILTSCARCLDDVRTVIAVRDLCFHFEKVRDLEVDLTDDVREELLLAIPSCFYCSPDCKGVCPSCGVNLNHGSCACASRPAEPEPDSAAPSPWDQLDALNLSAPKKAPAKKPAAKQSPAKKAPAKKPAAKKSSR
ncbi:MAG: DUF177 domain-containing protein [Lentisphaeria bacterium]|jgi:uncharacterized metal-binding protein YceD (DUF177 family)|nr:DUF177 domain-containing protein [Lentisphaeria bacterium]